MTTGVTCVVYVDGQRAADGTPGEDPGAPAILENLAVTWGRSDTMSQPSPDSCTFDVLDPIGGQAFTALYGTGKRIDVAAHGLTYADPSQPTFLNPGFETTAVTWAASGGAAARSSVRVQAGTQALSVKPTTAGQPATLWLAPGAFQAAGTNPDAWDAIPTTRAGQTWEGTVSLWLPKGASATVRAALYTGPYSTAGQAAGAPLTVVGNDTWQTVSAERAVQLDDVWMGFHIVMSPTGPAWNDVPPALTWNAVDPGLSWNDFGTMYVDNAQVTSPASGTGRSVLVFSGRITDLSAAWDDSLDSPVVKVTAMGFTADLENRVIADEPWTVERLDARAEKIIDLAGLPIELDIDSSVAGTLMTYRDVDAQGAAGMLKELAVSVDGVLWPAVHQSLGAYLRIEDPAQRAALLQLASEYGPPAVVQRTNLATTPRVVTSSQVGPGLMGWGPRWYGSAPGAGTTSVITGAVDGPAGVSSYLRKQWTVIPPSGRGGDVGFQHTNQYGTATGTTGRQITGGTTYTITSYIRASRAQAADVGFSLRIAWKDAAGVFLSTSAGVFTALPANVWTRLTVTGAAPPGAKYAEVISSNFGTMVGITVGDTLEGTALLMEAAAAPAVYFDGATPDTVTTNYAWTGAANASTSTQSTVQTQTVVIVQGDPDIGFDLSACLVLRDPVNWLQDVTDVVTRVAATWRVQGVDDEGLPTTADATELVIDPALETTYGTRGVSVSTQLQSATDAQEVAQRILSRTSPLGWRADGLTIDDDDVSADTTGIALMLDLLDGTSRIGAPIVLGDLPIWSPAGAAAGVYLEGGTYTFTGGRWVLQLSVSAAGGIGESVTWNELDPGWSWDEFDPFISWNDLRGVAGPSS